MKKILMFVKKNVLLSFFFIPNCSNAFEFKEIDWPEVSFPNESGVEFVSPYLIQNGMPLRIYKFNVESKPEDVEQFFYHQWKDQDTEVDILSYPLNGEWVVSSLKFPFMLTSQFHIEDEKTVGFLTITNFQLAGKSAGGKNTELGAGFPMPVDADVISETLAKEQIGYSRTLVFESRRSVKSLRTFLESRFESKGWAAEILPMARTGEQGVIFMRKGKSEVHITLNQNKGFSTVIAVEVVRGKS